MKLNNKDTISFNDFVKDNRYNIHKALYDLAVNKFKKKEIIKKNRVLVNILEIPNSDYMKPCDIIVTYLDGGVIKKMKTSLSKYWDNSYITSRKDFSDSDVLVSFVEPKENFFIVSRNYINNTITLRSKLSGNEITVSMKLSNYFPVSDELSLDNTFSKKIQNNQ